MSFHGGLTGVLLILIIWSRIHKAPVLNIADCLALVTPIGLFLGRIANFINGELVGRETHVPWAMIFPNYDTPRHPSQLYEALLEGPMLLSVVWLARARNYRREGQIAASFVIFYAIFRFTVEFTREPDQQLGYIAFGWLTMGQLLSAAIGLVGIIWWLYLQRSSPRSDSFPMAPRTPHEKIESTSSKNAFSAIPKTRGEKAGSPTPKSAK
jgi:phosphatidylglycerol:prolipoprotein diacylglycerol transferase